MADPEHDLDVDPAHRAAWEELRHVRARLSRLGDDGLDLILRKARAMNFWTGKPVSDAQLRQLYGLMIMGPTSNNGCPSRIIFVRSAEAKERLYPALHGNNVDKVRQAPVCAIFGYDMEFYEKLPEYFPHAPNQKQMFIDDPKRAADDAFRNGTLQGAYFMIAARALGLDVGPISGFRNDVVDAEFFQGTTVKSNFLCNVGHGDETSVFPRHPRPEFDDVCTII